jgi:hypothetical protein
MKRVLMAAMLAAVFGTSTGCRVVDTVLLGRPCCDGRAPCGTTCDPCAYGGGRTIGGGGDCGCSTGGDCGCGESCGCGDTGGGCGGCGTCGGCHPCPLFEMFGFLHPDRLLCAYEYRDCNGCGERYWGDHYSGQRAGCESCDCHGNYAGPRGGSYSPRSDRVIEEHHSEPTPAEAAPKPPVKPGPEQGAMIKKSSSVQRRSNVVPARATKSKQQPQLRPVGSEPEWTARRGR